MKQILPMASALVLSWLAAGFTVSRPKPADLILLNGNIITLTQQKGQFSAVVIQNDRILALLTDNEAREFVGPKTKVVDLKGATILPGLVDAHCHLLGLGMALANVNLVGTTSYAEVIELVKARAAKTPKGQWILGRGWDQNDWQNKHFPDHKALSAAVPNHPVWLTRIDGHAGLANSMAMEQAGITSKTKDPKGGRIVRDDKGLPTGVFVDNGEDLIYRIIPPLNSDQRRKLLESAARACLKVGLTGVHDMGIPPEQIADYEALADTDRLGLRVYAMISPPESIENAVGYLRKHRVEGNGDGMFTLRGLKLYMDGALGSRGAALLADYSDDPGNRGLLVTAPERVEKLCEAALKAGFQVSTHAIGDRGNRLVLDAYEKALKAHPSQDPRFRVEHVQVLSPEDIPRFAALGVIPSMQPTHATSDMYWAKDRLGADRLKGSYAWKSLLNTGVFIPCGSDFPIESNNPMLGIYAAVTRQDLKGWPKGGWIPEQRMSRKEALKGFTIWAAKAAFQEKDLGTIQVGKRADLTVVDRNPLTCEAKDIPETRVLYTIVNGRIRYQSIDSEQ
jgi:predicted amidohydrolase YtcJ